jgi:hypothetical protein
MRLTGPYRISGPGCLKRSGIAAWLFRQSAEPPYLMTADACWVRQRRGFLSDLLDLHQEMAVACL